VENPGEAIPGRVAISPNGQLLAFPYTVASSEPALKIGVSPIAGGPLVKRFDVAGGINGPRWSPDGRGLQYLLDKNGPTNLWEQPIARGPPRQITKFTSPIENASPQELEKLAQRVVPRLPEINDLLASIAACRTSTSLCATGFDGSDKSAHELSIHLWTNCF
jgi:hypothetical protein